METTKKFTRSEYKKLLVENEMLKIENEHYKAQVQILLKLTRIPLPQSCNQSRELNNDYLFLWSELKQRIMHYIFISRNDKKIRSLTSLDEKTYFNAIKEISNDLDRMGF